MSQILRPNSDRIAREVIEDEVIIIDLESGNYFNLAGTAADIWLLVEQQPTAEALIAALAGRYAAAPAEIAPTVEEFIDALASEALIVRDADGQASAGLQLSTEPRGSFAAPVLDKYTNMADLLLLDPIHDVDNKGWPTAQTNQ